MKLLLILLTYSCHITFVQKVDIILHMRSPVDWSHFNPPFSAGPPPPAGLPPRLLPLLLPLRMLLPHRRLLLRPLLVLLLLPKVAFNFLVLSTSSLLVP